MRISVLIVNFQGRGLTERCVASVATDPLAEEIIVVDNGSTDGSVELLQQQFPSRLQMMLLGKNLGSAVGWNRGTERATGDILLFLDNDTELSAGTLAAVKTLFEQDASIGAAQCKLLLKARPTRIDCVGEYFSQTGFLVSRALVGTEDTGQYEQIEEIFAAKSAAMAVRAEAFRASGGFNEWYLQYVIETDLCWRIWLAGYRVVYCPGTRVLHAWGGTEWVLSDRQRRWNIKFQAARNSLATLTKNLGGGALVRMLPVHASLWAALGLWLLLHGDRAGARGVWSGLLAYARNFPRLLAARKRIQANRHITDRDLFRRVLRRQPLTYFLHKMSIRVTPAPAPPSDRVRRV